MYHTNRISSYSIFNVINLLLIVYFYKLGGIEMLVPSGENRKEEILNYILFVIKLDNFHNVINHLY